RRLESELQQLADRVLGQGRAAIRVSAELNWDETETTSETYHPSGPNNGNLPLQDQETTQSYAGPTIRPVRGRPGLTTNLAAPAAIGPSSTVPGQYSNTSNKHEYAVSKVVEHRVAAPGKVRRLSIAVLLDQTLSAGQQQALKNAFAAAAGLDLSPATEG